MSSSCVHARRHGVGKSDPAPPPELHFGGWSEEETLGDSLESVLPASRLRRHRIDRSVLHACNPSGRTVRYFCSIGMTSHLDRASTKRRQSAPSAHFVVWFFLPVNPKPDPAGRLFSAPPSGPSTSVPETTA